MSGTIDVTLFSENFIDSRDCLIEDQLVIVEGEVVPDNFSNSYRIRATKAMNLDQARSVYADGLMLELKGSEISEDVLQKMYGILKDYQGGDCSVFISYIGDETGAKLILGDEWKVNPKEELLSKLQEQFGMDNVYFIY